MLTLLFYLTKYVKIIDKNIVKIRNLIQLVLKSLECGITINRGPWQ